MAFTLPHFNLSCNMWRFPDVPPGTPTAIFNVQLYLNSKNSMGSDTAFTAQAVPPMYLRLPPLSDIFPQDNVEVPAGSGRLYVVLWVDDAHKGFTNEYRIALLSQTFQPEPLP